MIRGLIRSSDAQALRTIIARTGGQEHEAWRATARSTSPSFAWLITRYARSHTSGPRESILAQVLSRTAMAVAQDAGRDAETAAGIADEATALVPTGRDPVAPSKTGEESWGPVSKGRNMNRTLLSAVVFALVLAVAGSLGPLPATAGEDACHDLTDPAYRSHPCKVQRLRQRPFVVVATVDSGINPYHEDFHLAPDDDRSDIHPSEYIEGFPVSPPLELTLDVSSPAEGRAVDSQAWQEASFSDEPLWVPGTNIIGMRTAAEDFFDEDGHGTGVASIAGGLRYGRGTSNVVLVAVKQGSTAFRWAADQPWIDVISLSFSSLAIVGSESNQAAKQAAASGKIVCAASGNTSTPIIFFHEQGPSSNVHVGAADPETDEMKDYSGWPNDVLGYTDQTAATHDSVDGTQTFGGTSAAAPHVCALIARTVSEARQRVGDATQGPHGGGLVVGPEHPGAMADGIMGRVEIEDAVQATARPLSEGDYRYVKEGYGLVSDATIPDALAVLFGEKPRPDRSDEDEWSETVDAARDTVWDHIP